MYNPNFYNNFHGNNFTFQRPPFVLPPPPPPYFPPEAPDLTDQEFVKKFESKPVTRNLPKPKTLSISEVKERLRNLVFLLNDIKDKETILKDNIDILSDAEWKITINQIEEKKLQISEFVAHVNDSYLGVLRKLLAKRSAKRMRLKRVALERKKEKADRMKELEERSRKIDENLQKIKDEINKAKEEEESKIQADIVLKEVLRKKHDAKKCIVKLEALVKLRRARQNTAKGRGESVSDKDAATFNSSLDKLKSLWTQKLSNYEKEELDLRTQLKQDKEEQSASSERDREVLEDLGKWREFLFGVRGVPQADFGGDLGRFIAVRTQWDQFLSSEGTALPVGWVLPNLETN